MMFSLLVFALLAFTVGFFFVLSVAQKDRQIMRQQQRLLDIKDERIRIYQHRIRLGDQMLKAQATRLPDN